MSEKIIDLTNVDISTLFGPNNDILEKIQRSFPDLKLIARGNKLKVVGRESKIDVLEKTIRNLINYILQHTALDMSQAERFIIGDDDVFVNNKQDKILTGNLGKVISARNNNHRRMMKEINDNDMMFVIGPAGTGKTYTSVALAIRSLKSKEVKRIVLTRPAVEAGESLGFLPGDMKEKLDPYMQPLYDALFDMIPSDRLYSYIDKKIIQIAPLAFMRGRTLDQAFVILDEAQNSTEAQMKMFLTRMGMSTKFIITGDVTQIDLSLKKKSGLLDSMNRLDNISGISFVHLNEKDVIRHQLVKKIIKAYKN